jgi:glucose/arabinose dehydrogenase
MRTPLRPLLPFALLACAACDESTGPGGPGDGDVELQATSVASGLTSPVFLTAPPGDDRLFVVEQPGRIRIIEDGQLLATPFLDIADLVKFQGEQGLFSVAFHPDYAANGFFFVDYIDNQDDTRVVRYRVSGDANVADAGSAKLILRVEQPAANHNGGLIVFGPDEMLYVGLGDGGGGGDPFDNGQDTGTLLGSLLRIDVDAGDPYAIPSDNPFQGVAGARGEIWAYGLRNPWRYSFDAAANRIYVADVGQNQWEEVNAVAADDGGVNYGWNIMEGLHCYQAGSCDQDGLTLPVLEYGHTGGSCSVTGGYVYRGDAIPEIAGHYFYGDACAGWVRSFALTDGQADQQTEWPFGNIGGILSFGVDDDGELYILSSNGNLYRVDPVRES